MRTLLIATNRHNRWMSREEVRPLPIGLAYVAAWIDPERHPLRVMDLMFSDDYLEDTEAVVRKFKPQLVGLSLRNLDNGSYINPQSALPITREVIQRIRACSDATITCGGPAFSMLPEECFEYLEPDIGLTGDAAETFAELLELLEQGKSYRELSGIVYRQSGKIKTSPQRAASRLNRPPRFDELDLSQYRQAGFGVGVITKLGWYPSTIGTPAATTTGASGEPGEEWRVVRPISDVIREILRLNRRYKLQEFFFIDQAFNRPVEYAKDLCRNIIEEGLDIKWNTNLVPQGCDRELISLMVEAGCRMILLAGGTVQAPASPGETLENVEFATRLAETQRLCDLCHSVGLKYTITQGFGEPGETERTIRTKLAFLSTASGKDRAAHANLRVGTRLLPGTALAHQAQQEGIIHATSDLLMPVFYITPGVRQILLPTLEAAVKGNSKWHIM
jgi:hypothetical protein